MIKDEHIKNIEDFESITYDLIFSENYEFNIKVSDYIYDIYMYDRFILKIKSILKKSKVSIIKEKIIIESDSVYWHIKVNK